MHLLLVRHSIAESGRARGDAARILTPEGVERADRLARTLQRMGLRADRLFHSPMARAAQTAERLSGALARAPELLDALAAPPTQSILYALEGRSVVFVGHQPWMSDLTAWMLTGERSTSARFPFEPAGAAWLSGEPQPGGMYLRAFLPPEALLG